MTELMEGSGVLSVLFWLGFAVGIAVTTLALIGFIVCTLPDIYLWKYDDEAQEEGNAQGH